jgi:hypothetical protein
MNRKTIGLTVRMSQNPHRAAVLQSRRSSVHSPTDRRKARATRQGRSSQCSESDAQDWKASNDDRALGRKDARLKGYTIRLPGQTGLRSFRAHFPELAAGREVRR